MTESEKKLNQSNWSNFGNKKGVDRKESRKSGLESKKVFIKKTFSEPNTKTSEPERSGPDWWYNAILKWKKKN